MDYTVYTKSKTITVWNEETVLSIKQLISSRWEMGNGGPIWRVGQLVPANLKTLLIQIETSIMWHISIGELLHINSDAIVCGLIAQECWFQSDLLRWMSSNNCDCYGGWLSHSGTNSNRMAAAIRSYGIGPFVFGFIPVPFEWPRRSGQLECRQ